MGLDIYVGSLTRYYSGNWETIIQQQGRLEGYTVHIMRENASVGTIRDSKRIHSNVLKWRKRISRALQNQLSAPVDWNEESDAPYFTDKPNWSCYCDLLLWAAYEEQRIFQKPKERLDDLTTDPAYRASTADGFESRYSHLLNGVELWLPCDFAFVATVPDIVDNEIQIGSSTTLLSQLQELNRRTWNADSSVLENWRYSGAEADAPVEIGARFAFAVFVQLAELSVQHSLPMKLDY